MRLNSEQRRILAALQGGCYLKIHRTLDGAKVYRLLLLPPAATTRARSCPPPRSTRSNGTATCKAT